MGLQNQTQLSDWTELRGSEKRKAGGKKEVMGWLKQETCEEEKGEAGDRRKSVDFSTTLALLAFERVKTNQNSIYFCFKLYADFLHD